MDPNNGVIKRLWCILLCCINIKAQKCLLVQSGALTKSHVGASDLDHYYSQVKPLMHMIPVDIKSIKSFVLGLCVVVSESNNM